MVVAVAVTLDRNAHRSSWQEHTTALAGGARVGASSFESLRANLRVQATQLATSLPLQRAVVTGNEAELRRIADDRHARIDLHGRSIGALAGSPRISSTATITDGLRVLATVTIALPLGDEVLTLLRQATPLPTHGGAGARAKRPRDRGRAGGRGRADQRRPRRPPGNGVRRTGGAARSGRHVARGRRAGLGDRRALGALPALRLPRRRRDAPARRRAREQARPAAGPGGRRRRAPDPAGAHRRSDGPRQPPRADRPARGRAPARRAERDEPLVRDRRHRRLQADQRRLRPSAGRRRDQGGRVRARRVGARDRPGGPLRRRGVRDRPSRRPARERAADGGRDPDCDRGARGAEPARASRSASRRASGSRSSRRTRRRRRCSRRPTPRCIRRSGPARTGSRPRRCTTTGWATTPAPPGFPSPCSSRARRILGSAWPPRARR